MEKVGVVGGGAMGRGIAQIAATKGHPTLLYDTDEKALEKAEEDHQRILDRLVEKGKLSAEKAKEVLKSIEYTHSIDDFSDTRVVIEAVVEELSVKKTVFKNLERVASSDTILATNTSSLSVASIAASCDLPGRVLGIHFFNPAPLMPLVEIIPAIQSDAEVVEKAKDLINSWGKVTVIAKDTPGFIVNRVARPFYGESLRIYEEGIADFATIDWSLKEAGFRMGPFELMDFIGNDINYTVTETVFSSFFYDERYKPAFTQKRMAEAGYLGRKTGKGYYNYAEGVIHPEPDKNPEISQSILRRVLMMLINGAADALFWQVATRDDIDLAMTRGVNYPKGLLRWADELGINNCVDQIDALYDRYREGRYRCCPLLREMANQGDTFY